MTTISVRIGKIVSFLSSFGRIWLQEENRFSRSFSLFTFGVVTKTVRAILTERDPIKLRGFTF
jgi:hypothetical protein